VQERYEALRSRWTDDNSPGTIGLLRLPWGQRLAHFGVLGLLDEDPTEVGWFGDHASPSHAQPVRCVRVLLGAEDVVMRDTYRGLLRAPAVAAAEQEVRG
jgi:hypothetical protein